MISTSSSRAALPIHHGTNIAAVEQARWLEDRLDRQPMHIRRALRQRHAEQARESVRKANIELRQNVEDYAGKLPADATDKRVKSWANRHTEQAAAIMDKHGNEHGGDPLWRYAAGHDFVIAAGLTPPKPDSKRSVDSCIKRMSCPQWWRRQARKTFGRRVEQYARSIGLVRAGAGLYISDDGFARYCERAAENRRLLEQSEAVNENTGETVSLAAIAELGLANPRIRRAELMARISGLEDCADSRGHAAIFVTWTVPPELHAAHAENGKPGAGRHRTPRDGQQWLCDQWNKCRAKLNRDGIKYSGMRVAEPHHDGTPHWHFLIFVPRDQQAALETALSNYAINGDRRAKRQRRACDIERIDQNRGSATGYVAKYVSKAVDGHALEDAVTRDADGALRALEIDPAEAANRVKAWASTWGIRQFQFIGAPPIGPWRELRRLGAVENPRTELLRQAADAGDSETYCELMGGPGAKLSDAPARVRRRPDEGVGRYGDALERVYLEAFGEAYETRPDRWFIDFRPTREPVTQSKDRIEVVLDDRKADPASVEAIGRVFAADWEQRSSEAASTWTRGNNCTRTRIAEAARPPWLGDQVKGFVPRRCGHHDRCGFPRVGNHERKPHNPNGRT